MNIKNSDRIKIIILNFSLFCVAVNITKSHAARKMAENEEPIDSLSSCHGNKIKKIKEKTKIDKNNHCFMLTFEGICIKENRLTFEGSKKTIAIPKIEKIRLKYAYEIS
jgi:hypothetical protein